MGKDSFGSEKIIECETFFYVICFLELYECKNFHLILLKSAI